MPGNLWWMDKRSSGGRRALSVGELALALFGLAVLAFGIGAGIGWTGLGWGLVPVAVLLIVIAFLLAFLRGRTAGRPVTLVSPPPAPPTPRPSRTRPAATRPAVTHRSVAHQSVPTGSFADEQPRAAFYLGIAGGAALALTLGGLLFLAVPRDATALVLLITGVVTWTSVVLLSFRLQLRR